MRQRLAIAAALLRPRELLILDEPTNGLDPQGTREVRHLIGDLAADGVTVLLSTHLLAEVEQICSHVGVMYEGRLVAQGPLDELRAQTARPSGWTPTGPRTRPGAARAGSGRGEVSAPASSPGLLGYVAVEKSCPLWCTPAYRCAGSPCSSRAWRMSSSP